MIVMRISAAVLLSCALLAGCAKSSSDIGATYVSPIQYQGYSCQQIGAEAARVSARTAQAAGVQDEKASSDAVATGVALVIFWPAALLVSGGNGQNAAELASLKGQFDALEQASIQKNCGLEFRKAPKAS